MTSWKHDWANKGYGHFSAKIMMGNTPHFDHEELFNLADDPFEFKDLAQDPQYAVLKKEMKEKLTELRYETMAPNIPGTVCDPLLKPGSNLALFTNCSIEKPHLCCPGTVVSQSLG